MDTVIKDIFTQEDNSPVASVTDDYLADELSECIANAKSLASVAIGSDFENFNPKTMHDYWGAINALLTKAEDMSQIIAIQWQKVCIS